jgi:eukaryotic-like serine/threonine-protein kinase
MILFTCEGCGKKLQVQDKAAGKVCTCPDCKKRVAIPAAVVLSPNPTAETTPPLSQRLPEPVTIARPEDTPSLAEGGADSLDFLAAPQGPGELGRLGPYRVLKVLGAGGMGMVLQAVDPSLQRQVALKVLRPELAARAEARERFLREARTTAAIEHPNIIHVYQVDQDRNVPFLAMPLLKGESLDARLKHGPRLTITEAVRLGRQIAEGLAAAHEAGLIHRDVKPANLWLEAKTGLIKILDFGLARVAADDGQLTKTGAILGTPAYMAPEQAMGERVDARCDLFSLGAVLYLMLSGERPFKGQDTMSQLAALATTTPRPVQELNATVPLPLGDLVMRLLAREPSRRPASARIVADTLAAIDEGRARLAPSDVHSPGGADSLPTTTLPPWRSKRRLSRSRWAMWLALSGGAGVIVLGVVLFVLFGPRAGSGNQPAPDDTPPEPEKKIANSIGMEFAYIKPGKFLMGSPDNELGHEMQDGPQHEVTITKPFYMGVHEVTVGQFREFVKSENYKPAGPWDGPGLPQTEKHPVVNVSWFDAVSFCDWLSKKEHHKYRLPTEAEWEYCCRAGTTGMYSFGSAKADEYAWTMANTRGGANQVGLLKPNAWGLYDMHGNAWEWVADNFEADYYQKSPKEDPTGPAAGLSRVVRGGGWGVDIALCSSAHRLTLPPLTCAVIFGFRVLREP